MIAHLPPDTGVVVYPESDGLPMAENTLQYQWIVTIQGNLDLQFANDPKVFVAGDNFIYPKKGDASIVYAPDIYVAFGRPKGHRGSYRVWEEGHIFPQVIFEVLSPSNTVSQMNKKRQFYRRWGAEEYYVIDPYEGWVEVWIREGKRFIEVVKVEGFVSPRLGIRFVKTDLELEVFGHSGRFLSFVELGQRAESESKRADKERKSADKERKLAENERKRAEKERERAEKEHERAEKEHERADREATSRQKLADKLRELGIDPDKVG